MEEPNVRFLTKSDVAPILSIYNYYVENTFATMEETPLSLDEFTERTEKIAERNPFLVAEENGEIVGYAYLDDFNVRSAYRYTRDLTIYLKNGTQGRGFGKKLLNAIEKEAKARGIKTLISIVTSENKISQAFHERNGFSLPCELPNLAYKFGKWISIKYYQKTL